MAAGGACLQRFSFSLKLRVIMRAWTGKQYVSESGRHVFDEMKVAHDEENVYFYAKVL